jgi:hypothetical protein
MWDEDAGSLIPIPLGRGYLVVRSRLRVTRDGGHSLLAVQDSHHATRLGRVAASNSTLSSAFTDAAPAGPSSKTYATRGDISAVPREDHASQVASLQANMPNVCGRVPLPSSFVPSSQSELTHGGYVNPALISQSAHPQPDQFVSSQRDAEEEDSDSDSDGEANVVPGQDGTRTGANSSLTPITTPSSFYPIVGVLAQAHASGYSRVAYSYLTKQLVKKKSKGFKKKQDLQASLDGGIRAGQIISMISNGGRFLSLPLNSVYRLPQSAIVRAVGDGENEITRLLQYLRTQSPAKRKQIRKHFKTKVPDAPYGQTPNQINSAINRACEAGEVNFGGEGKKAWISLRN